MNRSRILTVLGLTAVLVTVVWWILQHGGAPATGPHPENLAAASPSHSILPRDNSVTIGSSLPNSAAMNPARTRRPVQIFPAENTNPPSKAMPAGLERIRLVLNSISTVSY